ncbi:hypothetical protein OB13_20165 [Pontibacter sp. HJ8]
MQSFFLLLFLPVFFLSSCTDDCETTVSYIMYEPVYMQRAELSQSIKVTAPQALKAPGKIYVKGSYLFINEVDQGIHILDNSNPSAPRTISFIQIPGNRDLAVKGNILYADNYIDLVALDISDPQDVRLINRVENIFPNHYGMLTNEADKTFVATFEEKRVAQPVTSDCSGGPSPVFWRSSDGSTFAASPNQAAIPSGATGKGGSMARFTISGNHLYTVGQSNLQVLDISITTSPQKGNTIHLGWGIETIFPYKNMLFIGSTTGMHIYDNSNPENPVRLSTYAHVNSCDPVVVDGDLAWVTMRSGNTCARGVNQLDVLNISDPRNPRLLKSYPMQNPHGLGIDRSTLFLCEGQYGLKIFDVTDHLKVSENLTAHFKDQDAFDVIPLGNNLMLIGQDGLYQYDYSDLKKIRLLSKIPVTR